MMRSYSNPVTALEGIPYWRGHFRADKDGSSIEAITVKRKNRNLLSVATTPQFSKHAANDNHLPPYRSKPWVSPRALEIWSGRTLTAFFSCAIYFAIGYVFWRFW
jgi:hypothetical protein